MQARVSLDILIQIPVPRMLDFKVLKMALMDKYSIWTLEIVEMVPLSRMNYFMPWVGDY